MASTCTGDMAKGLCFFWVALCLLGCAGQKVSDTQCLPSFWVVNSTQAVGSCSLAEAGGDSLLAGQIADVQARAQIQRMLQVSLADTSKNVVSTTAQGLQVHTTNEHRISNASGGPRALIIAHETVCGKVFSLAQLEGF